MRNLISRLDHFIDRFSGFGPWVKYAPFLLLYAFICILLMPHELKGDEPRYIFFAENLLNGFYSPPAPDINLWNGPGYPLFMAVFMFVKVPLAVLPLLNAVLMYLSLMIVERSLSYYVSTKRAFIYTVLLALYFPIYIRIPYLLTESLTWFLLAASTYLVIKLFRSEAHSKKTLILASFTIAYLTLTKIIFGYVLLIMICLSLFFWVIPHFRKSALRIFALFSFSLLFCTPYLLYTYKLTNQVFYWGNSGSMSLYTMSTPFKGETGQWYGPNRLFENPNHAKFADSVYRLNTLERDKAFREKAIENIKAHPKKYLSNVFHNLGRLFFVPSDYVSGNVSAYLPIIPNLFIVVFMIITVITSILFYKRIPPELIYLLCFVMIYLFGSSLVSTYRRMFMITLPFWTVMFAYVFTRIISIKILERKTD